MLFSSRINTEQHLKLCAETGNFLDIIIAPEETSETGVLPLSEAGKLAEKALEYKLRPILLWDRIMSEDELRKVSKTLSNSDLSCWSAVRVSDKGALHYTLRKLKLPVQLNPACTGNNLNAIIEVSDYVKKFSVSLPEKIIISPELPLKDIQNIAPRVASHVEVTGAAPIIIFRTPRKLLSSCQSSENIKKAVCHSTDSDNRQFRVLENSKGTFTFLDKDIFVLNSKDKLENSSVESLFLDFQLCINLPDLYKLTGANPETSDWPFPCSELLFHNNDTVLKHRKFRFSNSSNRSPAYVGQVIAAKKDDYIAILTSRSHELTNLYLVTTHGEQMPISDAQFSTPCGKPVNSCKPGQLILSKWRRHITPGAVLFKKIDSF